MAGRYLDLLGTIFAKFRLGLNGPHISDETGEVAARNVDDDGYTAVRASLVRVFGDAFELNAGAAGSGDDWVMTLSRPDTGMTEAVTIVMPAGTPAPGQALTVASYAGGIVELAYSTVAGGTDKVVVDTTTIAFGESSPATMFTKPANAVVLGTKVVIDTQFDGGPQLSIGISGTPSKYMPSTAVDLTKPAGTVFEYDAALQAVGTTEGLIATYSAGGATAGSARVLVSYVIPS